MLRLGWISVLALIAASCTEDGGGDTDDAGGDGAPCEDVDGDSLCPPDDCDDSDPEIPGDAVEDERWIKEPVSPEYGRDVSYGSIAIDPSGRPVALYSRPSAPDDIVLERRGDKGWTDSVEIVPGLPGGAFDIDGSGVRRMVGSPAETSALQYADDAANEWRTEEIVPEYSNQGGFAIDLEGRVHVAFHYELRLHHAVRTDAGWTVEAIAEPPAGGFRTGASIAVAPDGTVYIVDETAVWTVDTCTTEFHPWHVTNETGEWLEEPIGEDLQGGAGHLQLDESGVLHVVVAEGWYSCSDIDTCCPDYSRNIGYYLRRDDGVWSVELELPETGDMNLDLDGAGHPHLLVNDRVYWASDSAGGWLQDPTVDYDSNYISYVVGAGALHVLSRGKEGLVYSTRPLQDGRDDDCDGIVW